MSFIFILYLILLYLKREDLKAGTLDPFFTNHMIPDENHESVTEKSNFYYVLFGVGPHYLILIKQDNIENTREI